MLKVPDQHKKFAEFFAGVGLVRLALEQGGWSCVFANDLDEKKLDIYKKNFSSQDFLLDDIWNLDASQVPNSANLFTASFPCVDLSVAGGRGGLDAERSGTFWALVDIISEKRKTGNAPKFILLENVYGFLTTNNGKELKNALVALNDLNYAVDVFVVDAKYFTPQSRTRLFVLAVDNKFSSKQIIRRQNPDMFSKWQAEVFETFPDLRPKRLLNFIIENETLDWFTVSTPKLPYRNISLQDIIEHYESDHEIWWQGEKHEKILSQIPDHQLDYLKSHKNDQEFSYGTLFRRMRKGKSTAELRNDGIAGCLRTPRGGSSKQILGRSGKGEILFRLLTPREYARLQGVNDEFLLSDKNTNSYFAMGDAVCVPAINWIAQNYLNKLVNPEVI